MSGLKHTHTPIRSLLIKKRHDRLVLSVAKHHYPIHISLEVYEKQMQSSKQILNTTHCSKVKEGVLRVKLVYKGVDLVNMMQSVYAYVKISFQKF